jgi:hypothetical protein
MSTARGELMRPVASPSFGLDLSLKERAVTDFVNGSIREEYHVLYEVYDRRGLSLTERECIGERTLIRILGI